MIEPFVHITGVASSSVLSIATKDLSVKHTPCIQTPPPPYAGPGPAAALLAVSMDDTATTTTLKFLHKVLK